MSHLNDPIICRTIDPTEMYSMAINLQDQVEQLTTELNSTRQQLERGMAQQSKTNDILEKTQVLLQTVISHAPIVLWLLDQDSRFTLLDGKGLENSGIDPSQLIGHSIFDLYCNSPQLGEIITSIFAGNERNWMAEIGDFVYENRALPMREKNHQIVGIIGISTDVTLRHQSEAALQKAKIELELRVEERTAALKESNDQLVIEIVEHLQAEKALCYRVEFEQLIATLSTQFINLTPEEIDSGINHALKAIATFSGVDRSYLFLLDEEGNQLHNTHEWCAPGISPQIHHRQGISVKSLHWWQQQIYQLETIYIPSVAKLPRSQRTAKAILRSQSIQSLIVVPMTYRGSLIGFLGFDAVKVEKTWSEDIIALLRIVGEMFVNALDRKQVKEALKESEKKYRNFVETSQDLIWSVDVAGNFTFVNSAAKQIYGYEPAEIIGRKFTDFLPSEQQKDYRKICDEQMLVAARNSGQTCPYFPYETIHLRRDGTPVYLSVKSIVHKGENGSILGITGTATDISDRKRAEAQKTHLITSLQESESKFRSLYEATSDAVILLDERGFFGCNRATLKMFGCTDQTEFCAKHPIEFSPSFQPGGQESITLGKQRISTALETGSNRFEWIHQRLDGSIFPAEVLLTAMEIDGKKVIQAVVRDITERKRDEEKIKASLAEKEVLLKEIHHRVKNNLQVISSLLRLQSRYIQDQQIIEMLKESQNRVRSMALVHEQLYQSKDLSRINFAEYIHNLATNLFQAYEVNENGVILKISVATIYFNIDTAVHCGLIINELVSNSLKYAFVNDCQKGELQIDFLVENQQFKLSVSDNGIGFPLNLDFRNSGSLGLRLVCSLVNQLRGTIELDQNSGTTFTITFYPKKLTLGE
jgi:PAS domain S-box-containing protein